MPDSCAYIRQYYGVPAEVGMRVKFHFLINPFGNPTSQTGVIKGADHHLFVLLDGEKKPRRFHPTWLISYLDEHGNTIKEYGDD